MYDTLAGILFLGTPHTRKGAGDHRSVVELILRATSIKPLPRNMFHAESDHALFVELCVDFERIAKTIPVLSAYEAKPTKVYRNTFVRIPRPKDTQVCEGPGSAVSLKDQRPLTDVVLSIDHRASQLYSGCQPRRAIPSGMHTCGSL